MTEWIDHRWYGPAEKVELARDALFADTTIIGAIIPPIGTPLRVLDGDAAISFAAREVITLPDGLKDDKPELITALHGFVV